jgi:hypothetical protein
MDGRGVWHFHTVPHALREIIHGNSARRIRAENGVSRATPRSGEVAGSCTKNEAAHEHETRARLDFYKASRTQSRHELPPNNSGDAIETLQRVDRRRVAVHRRPGGA